MRFSSGCITAALVLAGAAAPVSAQSFEGRIAFKVSDERGTAHEMEYQVRANKMRFEMAGRGGQSMAMVMDPANQKILMLMPGQKMYMERPLAPVAEAARGAEGKASVTATGRKETIAGHVCEHFLITDEQGAQVERRSPVEGVQHVEVAVGEAGAGGEGQDRGHRFAPGSSAPASGDRVERIVRPGAWRRLGADVEPRVQGRPRVGRPLPPPSPPE